MQQFDQEYLKRREKQIQESYMLRANTIACGVTTVVLVAIGLLLMNTGSEFIGTGLFVFGLLFGAGTIFMTASYFAQKGADRAIEQERAELLALYGQMMEKPKRNGQETSFRLSDDGELVAADTADESAQQSARREG